MKNKKLWIKIKNFNLDDKSSDFTFSKRLARDNNWKLEYAKKVIEEYKKFIYLCCTSSTSITPSDAVDQAWHLHLTYTKSYWKNFCGDTLGKEIHHNPTKGGSLEKVKFSKCYDFTFTKYKSEFNAEPPATIWFNNSKRFNEINYKRINLDEFWLVKKPTRKIFSTLKIIFIFLLAPALFIQAKDNSSSSSVLFLILIIIVFVLIIGNKKNNGDDGCTFDSFDDGCDSGCSGCSGCGD